MFAYLCTNFTPPFLQQTVRSLLFASSQVQIPCLCCRKFSSRILTRNYDDIHKDEGNSYMGLRHEVVACRIWMYMTLWYLTAMHDWRAIRGASDATAVTSYICIFIISTENWYPSTTQDFSLTHLVEMETGAAAVLFRDLCNAVLTAESSCGN